MKKFTKIACITAGIMFAIGAILATAGIVAGAKSGIFIDWTSHGIRIVPQNDTYTYEAYDITDINAIDINVSNAAIKFVPSENDKWGIVTTYNYYKNAPEINTSNGKISVTQASHSGWEMVGIINLLFKSLDNSITIYVPAGSPLISSIKINTDNSAIKSDCALNTEILNIETSNGAIKLNNLSVSKQTQIKTSNGLISLNGNFSGDSNLKTSNGKIEVAGLIKDLFTAKTSNGSVDIDVNRPESEYSIYGKTSNGSVKVNGENHSTDYASYSSTSNTINAQTSNGAINLDFAR